jgi:hypothetical protein
MRDYELLLSIGLSASVGKLQHMSQNNLYSKKCEFHINVTAGKNKGTYPIFNLRFYLIF